MNKKTLRVIAVALACVLVLCVAGGAGFFFVYPQWMNTRFEVTDIHERDGVTRRQLLVGKTNHEEQYQKPADFEIGQPDLDFSRLATTYYHRAGPVGRAMETMNWFPGPENTYWADARMPASLVAQCAIFGTLPLAPLTNVWSEPPVGKVMLAGGGIASYARPYQWLDFYERNPDIVKLSLPKPGTLSKFSFIEDAQARGANVRVRTGPERKTLADQGPRGFYKLLIVDLLHGGTSFLRSSLMSTDLMTKEAMALYFETLTDDGILLMHTSNRAYDLPPVVADVAKSLGLASALAHDDRRFGPKGHFTSEWVLVARRPEYLAQVKAHIPLARLNQGIQWTPLHASARAPWSDGGANSYWEIERGAPQE